jgi:hypothetical protein
MTQLFRRKPIAELVDEATGLKRELGAGDLIMLAIGAVIGAGSSRPSARPPRERRCRRAKSCATAPGRR